MIKLNNSEIYFSNHAWGQKLGGICMCLPELKQAILSKAVNWVQWHKFCFKTIYMYVVRNFEINIQMYYKNWSADDRRGKIYACVSAMHTVSRACFQV